MNTRSTRPLRFNGSIWCNLDVVMRGLDQVYGQIVEPFGVTVIEWYILRALYDQDGQHASKLAHIVGRAATSFTPVLDGLQAKDMIERRPDPADRRAVRIHLTTKGSAARDAILASADQIETKLQELVSVKDFQGFQAVLLVLQSMPLQ